MDLYAVMGNPIEHSKSPYIHSEFAAQTEQPLQYGSVLVPENNFPDFVEKFFRPSGVMDGKGVNVTVPFKEQAYQLAEVLSQRAQRAGAVNTLMIGKDGKLFGDNTDGVGLVRDIIDNHGGLLKGKRILILGAGGAVRGVLKPIIDQQPHSLTIANRTVSKAENLAEIFADDMGIHACGFDELNGQQFDVVINGTAASLQGKVPPLPDDLLANSAWCYDMMYSADTTAFNQWAAEHQAEKIIDGLGMLVEQAAESFFIWRNVRPTTQGLIEKLRQQMSS